MSKFSPSWLSIVLRVYLLKGFIEQLINNLSCSVFHTQPNVFAEGKEISSACKLRLRIEAASKLFSRLDKTTLASLLAHHFTNLKPQFLNKLVASSAIFCGSSKPGVLNLWPHGQNGQQKISVGPRKFYDSRICVLKTKIFV